MNFYELTVDQTTPGEIIANGVVITIEGMLVVFAILVLIMLSIYIMGLFSGGKKTKKAKVAEPVDSKETVDIVYSKSTDESELIAVLAAAVAACMGTNPASVSIKSYKRVSSAWSNVAKREVLEKF